jgi:hypothetical protein
MRLWVPTKNTYVAANLLGILRWAIAEPIIAASPYQARYQSEKSLVSAGTISCRLHFHWFARSESGSCTS